MDVDSTFNNWDMFDADIPIYSNTLRVPPCSETKIAMVKLSFMDFRRSLGQNALKFLPLFTSAKRRSTGASASLLSP